jgi:HlyD family secretion protein
MEKTNRAGKPVEAGNASATVWVKQGEIIHPVQVATGMSDETSVEIKSGLKEGELVVVSMEKAKAAAAKTETSSSPFMPKRPGSAKK